MKTNHITIERKTIQPNHKNLILKYKFKKKRLPRKKKKALKRRRFVWCKGWVDYYMDLPERVSPRLIIPKNTEVKMMSKEDIK